MKKPIPKLAFVLGLLSFLFPLATANALDETELGSLRAGYSVQNNTTVTSNQSMTANSSGNSVNVVGDMTNGSITVGQFGGSGFGSYVMNTGNNAVINSGVSLSVLTLQQ